MNTALIESGYRDRVWIVLAVTIAIVSSVLNWQGWKHQWEMMDDRNINIDEAYRLIHEGRLPVIGGYASVGGFNPPGISYLYAVGFLSGDFRLLERPGPLLTHLLTLWGIWKLTVSLADRPTAVLALGIYCCSWLGIFYGSSLWPRSTTVCFIWYVYFVVKWVQRSSPWSFCWAICLYALNAYIFLESLPALLGLPFIWWIYRPRVSWTAAITASLIIFGIWYPYLKFEWEREFVDLRQQLISHQDPSNSRLLVSHQAHLEYYDRTTKTIGPFQPPPELEDLAPLQARMRAVFFKALKSCTNTFSIVGRSNKWGLLPYAFLMIQLIAVGYRLWKNANYRIPPTLLTSAGLGLAFAAIGSNPWIAELLLKRALEAQEVAKIVVAEGFLFGAAAILFFHRYIAAILEKIASIWTNHASDPARFQRLAVTWWAMVPAWLVMCVLSKFDRYLWWTWSIQAVFLAMAIGYFPRLRRWPCWLVAGLVSYIVVFYCLQGGLVSRAQRWQDEGFSGRDLPAVLALDEIARESKAVAKKTVNLGYHIWFQGYEYLFTEFESRYKLGKPLDQYLAFQHGITNNNAEKNGISMYDDYRIVFPEPQSRFVNYRWKPTDMDQFELIKTYDDIPDQRVELWKRK